MSIRYSVVGRANQVLVSSGNGGGNIATVAENLLSRVNTDIDDRKSYTADKYDAVSRTFFDSPSVLIVY